MLILRIMFSMHAFRFAWIVSISSQMRMFKSFILRASWAMVCVCVYTRTTLWPNGNDDADVCFVMFCCVVLLLVRIVHYSTKSILISIAPVKQATVGIHPLAPVFFSTSSFVVDSVCFGDCVTGARQMKTASQNALVHFICLML